MAFGEAFRPVLTSGAELGSDGAGARSAPMMERSEVTRSDRQRSASQTVISARGLRISYGDFEAVRGIDLEGSRTRNSTPSWHRHRSTALFRQSRTQAGEDLQPPDHYELAGGATSYEVHPLAEMRGPTPIGTTQAE